MNEKLSAVNFADACIEIDGDFDDFNRLAIEKGWGDGLPLVPPTQQRVAEMLAWCDHPPDQAIHVLAPRYGEATPLRLAANAVMAGCKPEYFPLVLLAIEALCEEQFNLYSVQATTHPCAPLLIFNGPIARELKINFGANVFGPGTQSNATIGRAIRLALLNIGGASPGIGDMATLGTPAKYTYCIAENESASPWDPLNVELGFSAQTTTVTAVAVEAPHNVNDHKSVSAEGLLTTMAGTMAITGSNDVMFVSQQPVLIICPEHAAILAKGGFSKIQVKNYLQGHAWLPMSKFSKENIKLRFQSPVQFKDRYINADADAPIFAFQNAEDLIIVVAGGPGKHSAYIPSYGGGTRSVTKPLRRKDGEFAVSINDFRQQ